MHADINRHTAKDIANHPTEECIFTALQIAEKRGELKPRFIKWPYLDMSFDIRWFYFRTSLIYERYELQQKEWILLEWRFFKCSGHVKLYSPERKRYQ